jgi:hypothetical protein
VPATAAVGGDDLMDRGVGVHARGERPEGEQEGAGDDGEEPRGSEACGCYRWVGCGLPAAVVCQIYVPPVVGFMRATAHVPRTIAREGMQGRYRGRREG